jgi:hypothetical protein
VVFADDIAFVRRTGEEPPENILKKTGKWKLEGDRKFRDLHDGNKRRLLESGERIDDLMRRTRIRMLG